MQSLLSNTAGCEDVVFTIHPRRVNLGDVWIAEGFSTSNPFPKFMTSEQAIHSPHKKTATKELQGEPNSHSPRGVIPTEASSYCLSFDQEPIQNNSWKCKPSYYPLHHQVVGVFVFYYVYCEVGLSFFLPARNQKLIIFITRLIWLWKNSPSNVNLQASTQMQ